MKPLVVISCLSALAAILIGGVGAFLVDRNARLNTEREFKNTLVSVAAIVASNQWHEPWESDRAWSALENRLSLAILPVLFSADQLPDDHFQKIEWTQAASGKCLISANVALAVNSATNSQANSQPSVYLRVTREVRDSGVLRIWWISWLSVFLLGTTLVALILAMHSRSQSRLVGLFEPWLAAVRSKSVGLGFLPKLDCDSELEPSLGILAESINKIIGDLHGENERSELVLGNLQEGVLAIDEKSHVLLANPALYRLLGIAAETKTERLLLELVRVPLVNEVAERILKHGSPAEVTLELNSPPRALRILGLPLPLPSPGSSLRHPANSQRFGALLTIRDETVLRRIEAVRRDFVANASHELKTPLAAIRAYAETLQIGGLDDRPAAERFVTCIIEQADRINGLVQGMLQLSRVESGTAIKIEMFDAREAIEPCIAAAVAVARGKRIQLSSQLPDLPLNIRCDRTGFQTIASNLLSNAVRYTHDGGEVSVRLASADQQCLLQVRDTGIGIHPEDLVRIFERFYRAEKDRSTETGGTGLGLSIVKHLVNALGGSVQATSEPGRGSTFEVRLPLTSRQG